MNEPKRIITLRIDDLEITVEAGTTVAAAIGNMKPRRDLRRLVAGEARSALCGMGICFECRVTIDGREHERSCNVACREGMSVRTGS